MEESLNDGSISGMTRRAFLAMSGKAGAMMGVAPMIPFPGALSRADGLAQDEREVFRKWLEQLRGMLIDAVQRSKISFGPGREWHSPSVSATYRGIWPDDFLYPLMVHKGFYTKEALTDIAGFLTDSIVDLPCFPDRVEADGMPVMQPGSLGSPHAMHMPLHLPAAWVRLMDHLEQWGAVIPRKDDWANIYQRSMAIVPFSCGLAYVDPQHPGVDFGFHDPEAITGFVLMSSMLHFYGLRRAARFFRGHIAPAVIRQWELHAAAIKKNLHRLYDKEQGAFFAGSKDCRQVNVWGNGLAYWMSEAPVKKAIVDWYRRHKEEIFMNGFTRQIAEPGGWQRQLVNVPVGSYTNGGFWSIGTGWVLPAIADQDPAFAESIAGQMVDNLGKMGVPEWIGAKGAGGATGFLAAIAGPMMGLKAIVERRPLSDYF